MTFLRFSLLIGTLVSLASYAQAGMRFDYQGSHERSDSGRPFNFGVSTTSHYPPGLGIWTPQDITGKNHGGGHHQLSVRRGLQVDRHEEGTFSTVQSMAKSSKNRRKKSEQAGAINAGAALPNIGNGDSASEMTNGQRPVNTRYCYCPGNPGDGDDDDDDDQTGDDDDDGGQTGDDDDDDNGGGEGGGPDPSVVPEPGSFALWAFAGALLVGMTRRQPGI